MAKQKFPNVSTRPFMFSAYFLCKLYKTVTTDAQAKSNSYSISVVLIFKSVRQSACSDRK